MCVTSLNTIFKNFSLITFLPPPLFYSIAISCRKKCNKINIYHFFFENDDLAYPVSHILRRRKGPEDWRTDVSRKQSRARISRMNMLIYRHTRAHAHIHLCASSHANGYDWLPKFFLFVFISLGFISNGHRKREGTLFIFFIL